MNKKLPTVDIKVDQCKGCMLCIDSCPQKVLTMSTTFNILGYQFAQLSAEGCTGCDSCYYACPEPGAITIIKERKKRATP
ncbi:MAG: hypothetical protein A2583_06155 [Bdellovibrionales bacterium RIFOXYD1_FULL_53_11]|nr:MAG: hypothetical protein A2583_06155 [Bdellovibrionales bacterium RIFOXYD1_FULL_53_11]